MIPQILDLLVAIPKIADMVRSAVAQIVLWYINGQQTETLAKIADAAAFAARAQTDDDRFQAAEKWKDALSRPRIIP